MSANPKPLHSFRYNDTERAIVQSYANASQLPVSKLFELQRRMRGVLPEQRIVATRKLLNVNRQGMKALPEPTGGQVSQISVALPV